MSPSGKTLFSYCRMCCGKCCKAGRIEGAVLCKYDIKRLKKAGKKFKVCRDGDILRLKSEKGKCVFLGPKGCTLKESIKPLDCKLFPVHFHYWGKKKLRYTISLDCPYWSKVPKAYVKNAQKIAAKELKHWTKKEQLGYWW